MRAKLSACGLLQPAARECAVIHPESSLILLGLISHLDLCRSRDRSVGVSGRGIIRVQLPVCRAHHLQEDTTAAEDSKRVCSGCKVELTLILTDLYIFFQNSAVGFGVVVFFFTWIVEDTAHSEVFINVLPMLHMKENGALMCVNM